MCCKQHNGKEATKAVASFFESFFCEGMKRGVPQVAAAPFRGAGSSPPTGTADRAGSNARARCGTEYLSGHVLTTNFVELRVAMIRRSDTSSTREAITDGQYTTDCCFGFPVRLWLVWAFEEFPEFFQRQEHKHHHCCDEI